ncbi:hypothetical protein PRK78_005262 [Emydomyces testavorans]|uniref:Uncharacterized protein n=1 Tax=Emydomyces testavorans TaxID=2070801 RepID=A0AAF0DLE4_9EURO|nr:hypothetical protein PRK78_005262 [Emydomyces testavorans]
MAAPLQKESNTSLQEPNAESLEKHESDVSSAITDGWDTERKLVLALCQLQEMEVKIQKLRTLVPTRLWSPLVPVIAEKKGDFRFPKPKSPQELFDQLSQAAREGNEEVEAFKSAWRGAEMQATWAFIGEKLKESDGDYPQSTELWERDYDVILKQLDAEEAQKEEQKTQERENQERRRLASIDSERKSIVESFAANENTGITAKIRPSADNIGRFTVLLRNISALFFVQQVNDFDGQSIEEWHVIMEARPNSTKLEQEVFNCIQSRERKWDLRILSPHIAMSKQHHASFATD